MTAIIKTDQDKPSEESIEAAAEVIRAGGLVVFPTETVYGLGANAYSPEACLKVFRAKERPADNPLIVHISDLEMIREITTGVSAGLMEKLGKIWPGPLTILFPKSEMIPDTVTGGSHLVAVRMPNNRLALDLIRKSGVPIAAPSANISTRPSITDSKHAIEELNGKVDLIMDCGRTLQGVESTIIDVSGEGTTLLRAGAMTVEELEAVFGPVNVTDFARGLLESSVPLAPGMKYRHYSPSRRLYLAPSDEFLKLVSSKEELKGRIVVIGSDETCKGAKVDCINLGHEYDPDAIARNLFSALRDLDTYHCTMGIIQSFPEPGIGLAIMNRIRKASSGELGSMEDLVGLLQ